MANDFYNRAKSFSASTKAKGSDVVSELDSVAAGFLKMPSLESIQKGATNFVTAGGTADALTITSPVKVITTYTGQDGLLYLVKAIGTNTGAMTVNVDGVGVVSLVTADQAAASAGSVKINGIYTIIYNETVGKFVFTDEASASIFADNAEASATASAASAVTSADEAGYSQDWAITPEDTLVPVAAGGDGVTDYSSLHWAAKASALYGIDDAVTSLSTTYSSTKIVDEFVQLATSGTITARHTIQDATPGFYLDETDQGADLGVVHVVVDAGTFQIQSVNDALAYLTTMFSVSRAGNANFAGTVDGRDVATDGTKLDGVATSANNYTHPSDGVDPGAALTGANVFSDVTVNAAGHVTGSATRAMTLADLGYTGETDATADQTKADIDALNVDADTVDGLHASALVRSDVFDDQTGGLRVNRDPGAAVTYTGGHLELKSNDAGVSDVSMGFHRSGATACQLRHESNGLILSGSARATAANFQALGTVTGSNLSGTNTGDEVAATESTAGVVERLTQAEVDAGTDTTRYPSIAKLLGGFAVSKAANGYIRLPTWLGGVTLQWGLTATIGFDATSTITFPLAFTTACRSVQTTMAHTATSDFVTRVTAVGTTSFDLTSHGVAATHYWVAIGY